MTSFFFECWEKRKKGRGLLFLPVFVVCFFVALMFAGLILLVDWMLQWTLEGVRKAGKLIIYSGFMLFGLVIFFEALPQGNLLSILAGLGAFSVWTWTTLDYLTEWRRG